MFASTLTKCLDQMFQTTMIALNDESLNLMQNLGMFRNHYTHISKGAFILFYSSELFH